MSDPLKEAVSDYYAQKLALHGPTALGVDWSSSDSQNKRFEQLSKIIDPSSSCSVLDYGCGYAALYDFLTSNQYSFDYLGFDWCEHMVETGNARVSNASNFSISSGPTCAEVKDYVIASGIFNVRLDFDTTEWERYVLDTISNLHKLSLKGFAFNCLTSYSDPERMRTDLYYADPLKLFDHCKRNFSNNVALLHDYDLYEFTMLVRK